MMTPIEGNDDCIGEEPENPPHPPNVLQSTDDDDSHRPDGRICSELQICRSIRAGERGNKLPACRFVASG